MPSHALSTSHSSGASVVSSSLMTSMTRWSLPPSASSSAMHELELRLLMGLFGAVWTAGGLAIATNFRGFTEWHARRTVHMTGLSEERVARQAALGRFIGAVFAIVGAIALVASFFVHFRPS